MSRRAAMPVLLGAALAVALATAACTPAPAAGPAAPDTVTVQGTGTTMAPPDQADIVFTAFARRPDAKAAMTAAGKAAEAIVAALRKSGLDEKDLQTAGVTLQPEYAYREGAAPRITGYRADVAVKATVKEIGKLADVVSAGTGAGALEVQGPHFRLADDNPKRFEAIEKAVADAQARAKAMAEAGGRSVGQVVRMSDSVAQAEPPWGDRTARYAYGDVAGAIPDAAVQPGQLEMTAQVLVEFRLK